MIRNQRKLPIEKSLDRNLKILEQRMGLNDSFDVMVRQMTFGDKRTALLHINGLVKEDMLTEILKRLSYADAKEIDSQPLHHFFQEFIPHIEVELADDLDEVIAQVLTGMSALFIDGEDRCILIDAKSFPNRGIEEPSLEKVVRGSRDGFVETMLTNIAMVRRRLRDPNLTFHVLRVGKRTKTDICIGFIKDIADEGFVKEIKERINGVEVDGIPLADKQLEEIIIGKTWNPYPSVRYSERPDVIANHILEGHIIIFADTSPSAMILPTTFFHHVQHAEEYRQEPTTGTYLRWVRFLGILMSLFLLPLWFLFVTEPHLKTEALDFIGPRESSELPLLFQFIAAEIGVDLMRMAAVHTPTPLATAMGLIAAILIGEMAVQTGLFVNEVILYLSLATIGMFATPSYELGLANRIVRLILLIAVALFKVPGFVIGTTLFIVALTLQRAFHSPYMWPFIPFNAKAFFRILLRRPVDHANHRSG